jgi:DNA-binding NarL/FixJ family response regulator
VSRTVLIVDDHAGFRTSARRMLESEGFEVVGEAGDGEGGFVAAAELAPELVLLDVQLPDIDGFEVAERMTGNGDGPAVVLTSTRERSDFGSLVGDSGARGFVAKSELSAELIEELVR